MTDLSPDHPYLLALIVVGAILQDDLTCIAVGAFLSAAKLSWLPAVAACFLGTLLGDLGWFFAARWAGRLAGIILPWARLRDSPRLAQARQLLDRHGGSAMVAARFLPGLRTPIQVLAGIGYRSAIRAVLYFTIAAAVYAPLLVGASAVIGDQLRLQTVYQRYGRLGGLAVAATAAFLWLALCGARWLFQRRKATE